MAEFGTRATIVADHDGVRPFAGQAAGTHAEREAAVARASGYAAGWSQGIAEAKAAAAAELQEQATHLNLLAEADHRRVETALLALEHAGGRLRSESLPQVEQMADLVLAAALELAESMVTHHIAARVEPGLETLRSALSMTADTARPLRVRMSVQDAATLGASQVPQGVEVVADPALQPGESIAEHDGGRVELLLAQALRRAQEALAGC